MLATFNTTINEKILAKLPTLFKKIPSMKLELVEESVRKSLNAKLEQDVENIKLSYTTGKKILTGSKYLIDSDYCILIRLISES